LGAWLGALLGGILYGFVIVVVGSEQPLLTLWLTIIFSALFVALLSYVYFDYTAIFGSAICGSYLLLRVIIT
jgi:hypothetical protein